RRASRDDTAVGFRSVSAPSHPCAQVELRHDPARVPGHYPRDRDDDHKSQHEQDCPPQQIPAARDETELLVRAFEVAAIPACRSSGNPGRAATVDQRYVMEPLPTEQRPITTG